MRCGTKTSAFVERMKSGERGNPTMHQSAARFGPLTKLHKRLRLMLLHA